MTLPYLSPDQLRLARLRAQHLTPDTTLEDPVAVARAVCGIQAQDLPAAGLAVRVRTGDLTAGHVTKAIESRRLVRTWLMRGTLHLIAAADLRWLLALHGPGSAAAARGRRAELGFDDASAERAARLIHDALAERGPLTRAEIADRLAAAGLPHEGQATIHAIQLAACQGAVCCGPVRAGKATYVRLDDWVAPSKPMEQDLALAELARRYLRGYGPAAFDDFVAWSRLPAGQLRRGWNAIADETREVTSPVRGTRVLADAEPLPPTSRTPAVRLAGAFDTYLLGYHGRELAVPAEHAARVKPGGGIIRPTVLVDGRAVGTWHIDRTKAGPKPVIETFGSVASEVDSAIEREARDVARFLSR
jgi:hypothetical protein